MTCKKCGGELSIRSNGSFGGKPRTKKYCLACERVRLKRFGPEIQASKKRWNERNVEKRQAHKLVENAIARGDLVPMPCELCGASAQAHHDDYSRPLDVRWLCQPHHAEHHRKMRRAA